MQYIIIIINIDECTFQILDVFILETGIEWLHFYFNVFTPHNV